MDSITPKPFEEDESVFDDAETAKDHFVDNFPHPAFRKGQKEAIEKITEAFCNGYKYVVLDAPTGAGKSAINTAFARGVDKSFYTTPQNSLVDQIDSDGDLQQYYGVIKGKSNYECKNTSCKKGDPGDHTAEECLNNENNDGTAKEICCDTHFIFEYMNAEDHQDPTFSDAHSLDKALRRESTCSYPLQLWDALNSDNMLTNLFLFCVAPYLGKRDIAIIDESHNLEDILFNFVDIAITTDTVPFFGEIKEELPTEDADKLEKYIVNDLKEACESEKEILDDNIKTVRESKGVDDVEKADLREYEEDKEKINELLDKIELIEELDEDFVVEEKEESDRVDGVILKPLYCGDFFQSNIAPKADRFLLSSATFGNAKESLEKLDIDRSEVKIISMESQFPAENRPIYFKDVTSMKRSEREDGDFKKLALSITDILNDYPDSKEIIHCVSYDNQRYLYQQLDDLGASDRMMSHESYNSDERLQEFKKKEDNTVFLSVAKEEGIDLADEDSRFNILVKVPNAYAGEPRTSYRLNERNEWGWYFNKTAIKMAQSYGRTTRSKDDWSDFYILDSYFWNFYQRNGDKLPSWFREAIQN